MDLPVGLDRCADLIQIVMIESESPCDWTRTLTSFEGQKDKRVSQVTLLQPLICESIGIELHEHVSGETKTQLAGFGSHTKVHFLHHLPIDPCFCACTWRKGH